MKSLSHAASAIGITLDSDQLSLFRRYFELLEEGGQQMNLTSVHGEELVEQQLFIRSLRVLAPAGGRVSTREWFSDRDVIDVGSGAGIPGIPIKLALPDTRVTLLEARSRKCDFLRHVVDELGLTGVSVYHGRAEDAGHDPELREKFDVATARAVAKLPSLAELVLPFVALGGVAVLPKGPEGDAIATEANMAAVAVAAMGAAESIIHRVDGPGSAPADHMVYWMKVRPTDAKYPRRPGVPMKRPLLADKVRVGGSN